MELEIKITNGVDDPVFNGLYIPLQEDILLEDKERLRDQILKAIESIQERNYLQFPPKPNQYGVIAYVHEVLDITDNIKNPPVLWKYISSHQKMLSLNFRTIHEGEIIT